MMRLRGANGTDLISLHCPKAGRRNPKRRRSGHRGQFRRSHLKLAKAGKGCAYASPKTFAPIQRAAAGRLG